MLYIDVVGGVGGLAFALYAPYAAVTNWNAWDSLKITAALIVSPIGAVLAFFVLRRLPKDWRLVSRISPQTTKIITWLGIPILLVLCLFAFAAISGSK